MTEASDYIAFTRALSAAEGQPQTACEALFDLTVRTLGAKLFTLMSFDFTTRLAERFYSNMPDAYPVSGTKPVEASDWTRQVLDERQIFVANDIESIAQVFGDHELIRSLGCEAVVNIPVVIGGEVAGTINCLHEAGFYTPQRLKTAEALKLPAAACFLLRERRTSV